MYIALDIGGTKTLLAVFNDDGDLTERIKFPTAKEYDQFKLDLANNAAKLTTKQFTSGAIGIRGVIDRDKGILITDSVLDWRDAPIGSLAHQTFGCPIAIENDSKMAGLSEAATSDADKLIYLTISTGIGSSFVVNHQIDPNTHNSEIGKSIYWYDGKFQKWEDFASGSALVNRYHLRAEDVTDDAIWDEITDDWAIGIINICLAYTPDIVVLGGSVGAHFDKYKTFLEQAIEDLRPKEIAMPPIRQSTHPDEEVVYGCYDLAKSIAAAR